MDPKVNGMLRGKDCAEYLLRGESGQAVTNNDWQISLLVSQANRAGPESTCLLLPCSHVLASSTRSQNDAKGGRLRYPVKNSNEPNDFVAAKV